MSDKQECHEQSEDHPQSAKRCIACGTDLFIITASICHICKAHQTAWKNRLQFFASIAALTSLLVTGIVFVTSHAMSYIGRIIAKGDLRVVELHIPGHSVFYNNSHDQILVTSIEARIDDPQPNDTVRLLTKGAYLNFVVKPKEYVTIGKGPLDEGHGTLMPLSKEGTSFANNTGVGTYNVFLPGDSEDNIVIPSFPCIATIKFQYSGSSGVIELPCRYRVGI